MQHFQVAGSSDVVTILAAAPRRPLTHCMYCDRWLHFAAWEQGIDPLGPTVAQVVSFLIILLFITHGLASQTIKGYLSYLASVILARELQCMIDLSLKSKVLWI